MSRHSSGPAGISPPVVRNAGSAREGDPAIDDQRFPVGAVVEPSQRVPVDRVVPRDLTAARLEDVEDLGADARGSDRIEQNLDVAAGLAPDPPARSRTHVRFRLPSRYRLRS